MIQFKLSNVFSKLGFGASLLVNSIFIYLTIFHIKHVFGTYKKLVVFFALAGILFSGLEVFAKPFAHNFNNSLVYFSLNDQFPEFLVLFAILSWAGFYLLIVSSIAIQFVFRYLCLLGSDKTRNLNWVQEIIWITYPIIPGCFYTTILYFLSLPDDYSDSYVREVIFENYSLVVSQLPRFIMVPYSPDGSIRWKNFSFLISACSLVFSHYLIILVCGLRMHFDMKKELKKFSVPNRKLQMQFFKALVFQSLGPTIFIFMPALPVFVSTLIPPSLGININWQTGWLYSMIGIYPPFDSIAFMMIVTEYGDVIGRRYFGISPGNSEISTLHVSEVYHQRAVNFIS